MYTWKNRCYDSFLFPEGIPGLIELKYEGLCLTTISSFAQHKWEKDGLISSVSEFNSYKQRIHVEDILNTLLADVL